MFLPMLGRNIYFEDIGSGPCVLLIHGLGGSTRYWSYTAAALAEQGFRVICFDLPGFGRSDLPACRLNVSDYVDVVDYLVQELCLDSVSVVGCSMGGLIAWLFAALRPDLVICTVLVSPVGIPSALNKLRREKPSIPSPAYLRLPGLGAMLKLCAHVAINKTIAFPIIHMAFAKPFSVSKEVFDLMRISAREMRVMHKGLLLWYGPQDPDQTLGSIKSPTLIVWGAKDRILPRSGPDYYLSHIPKAEFILYQESGHVPMLEVPDQFNQDLISFIRVAAASS